MVGCDKNLATPPRRSTCGLDFQLATDPIRSRLKMRDYHRSPVRLHVKKTVRLREKSASRRRCTAHSPPQTLGKKNNNKKTPAKKTRVAPKNWTNTPPPGSRIVWHKTTPPPKTFTFLTRSKEKSPRRPARFVFHRGGQRDLSWILPPRASDRNLQNRGRSDDDGPLEAAKLR